MIASVPIFASSDILATLAYYKEILGFQSSWTWGEPPTFGSATLGGVTIMFNLQPELATRVSGHQHWIKVDDADELYAKHRALGAKVVAEIDNKPWGAREYIVEDLHGYHLRFAGPPSDEAPKSNPSPEGLRLERRKPTEEEYESVAGGAFGPRNGKPGTLDATWNGVVAMTADGAAIGVVRIMWDAPGWYSIWDVAVLPEWQGRRIGSKLMEEALNLVREASPGAIVYLFTYKHGFYQRLGFGKETVSLIRL